MSKIKTAFSLILRPRKMVEVILEKMNGAVLAPVRDRIEQCVETQKIHAAARIDFGRPDMTQSEFAVKFGRLDNANMKAMIFSLFAGTSGNLASTNYYSNWIDGLRKNNVDAFWVAQEMREKPTIDLGFIDGPILKAPYKSKNFDVQEILAEETPDIILCHNNPVSMDFLESSNTGDAKIFVFIGDSMIPRIKDEKLRNRQISRVCANADGLIVVSKYLKRTWVNYGFEESRIFITKTPVNAEEWPEHQGSISGSVAGFFGNIYHKEIDNILEIAPIVREEIPSFEMLIFGDGAESDRESLVKRIQSLGLDNFVKVHKAVSMREMRKLQSEMDALVLPREFAEFSLAGFPNKVGEYLASGCPTVLTNTGEISKVIKDQEHAVIVEANDNKLFAKSLVECLTDSEDAKKMGIRGRDLISSYAAPKTVVAEFLEWVEKTYG